MKCTGICPPLCFLGLHPVDSSLHNNRLQPESTDLLLSCEVDYIYASFYWLVGWKKQQPHCNNSLAYPLLNPKHFWEALWPNQPPPFFPPVWFSCSWDCEHTSA